MWCTKHNTPKTKQYGIYHVYCPECDAEAVAEAKRVFGVTHPMKAIHAIVCCRCGAEFKAKTPRKKYCPPCLILQKREGEARRKGRYYIPVGARRQRS